MDATAVAIDLAKDVFELAFVDAGGRIVERKRLSRSAFSRCLLRLWAMTRDGASFDGDHVSVAPAAH